MAHSCPQAPGLEAARHAGIGRGETRRGSGHRARPRPGGHLRPACEM